MPKIFNAKRIKFEKRKSRIPEFLWHTSPKLAELSNAKHLQFDIRSLDSGKLSFPYHFHRAAEELLKAIAEVRKGNTFLCPSIVSIVVKNLDSQNNNKEASVSAKTIYHKLSSREREILQLLAEGKSAKEIASLLFLAQTTIKTHKANIFKKLHLRKTSELIRYAIKNGLVKI